MEAIKELEDIVAKTAKKTSNENRKKAVEALEVMFAETNDPKQVTEYLIKLHYSVCQAFLEEFCSSASDGSISAIVEALVSNEQFMKGNPNNIMYPKGLSAVLALASKEKYQSAFLVLLRILSQSEKSNGFSDGCVNNFKKLVVDKGGLPHILALFEQVSNGAVVCKEYEQRRFARFLKTVDNKTVVTTKEEVSTSAKKSELTKQPSSESDQLGNIDSAPEPKLTTKYDSAETVSKIEKTQQEILTAIRRLADNRSSIDSLTVTLARRDDELNSLRTTVSEKEHRVLSLVSELAVKDKQFLEAKGQIDELTQRLRASLQMDDISKSQELITLKNDISEALKLDYADYAIPTVNAVTPECHNEQSNDEFTKKKPSFLILFGETHSVNSWRDVLVCTCESLYTKTPQAVRDFDKNNNLNKKRPNFSWHKEAIKQRPTQLSFGIWVELNQNARTIMDICYKMLFECGFSSKDIRVVTQ